MTDELEKEIEAAANLWADDNHVTALVQKPEVNILFAKKLAEQAYLAGANWAIKRERERILEALKSWSYMDSYIDDIKAIIDGEPLL